MERLPRTEETNSFVDRAYLHQSLKKGKLENILNDIKGIQAEQIHTQNQLFDSQYTCTKEQKTVCNEQESFAGGDLSQLLIDRQSELIVLQQHLSLKQQTLFTEITDIQHVIQHAQDRIMDLNKEILKIQNILLEWKQPHSF